MKKLVILLSVIFCVAFLGSSAFAITVTTVDPVPFGDNEDFSDGTWEVTELGVTLDLLGKYEFGEGLQITGLGWLDTDFWGITFTDYNDDGEPISGTWGTDNPDVDYFSVKAGNSQSDGGFVLFEINDWEPLSESDQDAWIAWDTLDLDDKGLSHIAWWRVTDGDLPDDPDDPGDPETPPVPEPATMFLLGSGLFGLGIVRRKKQ